VEVLQRGQSQRRGKPAECQQIQAGLDSALAAGLLERALQLTVLVRRRENHCREWTGEAVETELQRSGGQTASQLVTASGRWLGTTEAEEYFVYEDYYLVGSLQKLVGGSQCWYVFRISFVLCVSSSTFVFR
jgi:hypothetical protein